MRKHPDEVYLSKRNKIEHWPVELAEKVLASPLPWGPPTYAFGGYIDDPTQPDQSDDVHALAFCVDGAYEHHGGDIGEAWKWARPLLHHLKSGGSCEQYATQDLLDLVFLNVRLERFSDGHIRSEEALLRDIVREVVRRVQSSHPPVFLVQK
ncbi:hypothetical protein KSC_072700 [Ktedonobacter sp. SOSP1-52]|uniref:hypothetical protein n=1 Tax=Ktedonobacter sp. SOSP1-52 TaxID=2778366 RepID=UPI001914E6D1|nr:hypothetical protein [Ktedonobacter sp. SOSP1-52]GHO68378.1 hypothetical protein KSC_072700 [Ktedonobacter sp. SOSP1-52]